jgi:tRNA A37 N6-isopentenylltransferase MiaA
MLVDADGVLKHDLGIGFNQSISPAGEYFQEIREENLRKAALKLDDESAGETVKKSLKENAREIAAGDDDELRRMIDIANLASEEFEALLSESRRKPK